MYTCAAPCQPVCAGPCTSLRVISMPSFRLRSTRRRSISRRALTRLESRTWAVCFGCAPQSRARSPNLNLVGRSPPACAICAHPARASGPRRTFRPVSLCLPCDSTERDCVQSAAELRHVQGRDNVIHVFGALRQLCSVVGRSPRACAICAQRPGPPPARCAPFDRIVMPSL